MMVELSPKALRFLIEAIDARVREMRAEMERVAGDEDALADLGNDERFYAAIRASFEGKLAEG